MKHIHTQHNLRMRHLISDRVKSSEKDGESTLCECVCVCVCKGGKWEKWYARYMVRTARHTTVPAMLFRLHFSWRCAKLKQAVKLWFSVCHARKPLFRATSRDGKYKITLPCVVSIVCNFICTKTKGEEISTLRWRGTFQLFVIPARVFFVWFACVR